MDTWFLFEIFVNFMTAYYQKTNLVTDKRKIFLNYLRNGLIMDLISSIPFSYIDVIERTIEGEDGGSNTAL